MRSLRRSHTTDLRAVVCATILLGACGSGPASPLTPRPPLAADPAPVSRWPLSVTITLTDAGPDPAEVTVNAGGRVTFVNRGARTREIVSDPYLRHEDCPATNAVGVLTTGQQRETRIYETARACGFHDHNDPAYAGRIHVRID